MLIAVLWVRSLNLGGISVGSRMKKGYDNFEDWEEDMKVVQNHPNDYKFLQKVISRVENTNKVVQDKIKEKIASNVFDKDPIGYYHLIKSTLPDGCFMIVKSHNDPWFFV